MSKITISEIPLDRKYTGYLWWSDAKEPLMLENKTLVSVLNGQTDESKPKTLTEVSNPFVVEAELFDEENGLSYHVQNAGNEIICQRYEVSKEDIRNARTDYVAKTHGLAIDENSGNGCVIRMRVYASRRMDGRGLVFLEYWEPRQHEDGLDTTLGMPAIELTRKAFVGFKDKED